MKFSLKVILMLAIKLVKLLNMIMVVVHFPIQHQLNTLHQFYHKFIIIMVVVIHLFHTQIMVVVMLIMHFRKLIFKFQNKMIIIQLYNHFIIIIINIYPVVIYQNQNQCHIHHQQHI